MLKFCGVDWVMDSREVEASYSVTITLDDSKPYDLDLCTEHATKLVLGELTQEFLNQYGTLSEGEIFGLRPAVIAPAPTYGKFRCPICHEPRTGRTGTIGHMVSIHGIDRVEASRQVPPAGESIECEQCGFLAQLGQGYGAHVRTEHGEKVWERIKRSQARK